MKTHFKHTSRTVLALAASVFMCIAGASCSSSIKVKANSDNSASMSLDLAAGSSISSVLKALFGTPDLDYMVSSEEIASAMRGMGFSEPQSDFPTASSIAMGGKATANTSPAASLIECSSNSLTVTVSPQILQRIFATLPEDTAYFLDLFIPPVYTGEELTATEYLELLAAFYGDELASELKNADVSLTLACPDGKKIRGTSSTEKTFSIPLVELLTLTQTVQWSIQF